MVQTGTNVGSIRERKRAALPQISAAIKDDRHDDLSEVMPKNVLFPDESTIMKDLYKKRAEYFKIWEENKRKIRIIKERRMENERKMRAHFRINSKLWNESNMKTFNRISLPMGIKRKTQSNEVNLHYQEVVKDKNLEGTDPYLKPPPLLPPLYKQKPTPIERIDYMKKRQSSQTDVDIGQARYLRLPSSHENTINENLIQ